MSEPFVSVIVPIRNEERYIERCLYTLARQDYPRERFEVIVVDGRSDDATRPIVNRFAAETMMDVTLLDNPRRRTAAGLNIGLEAARGDVIVRVDGHAAVAPDFLRRSVAGLLDTGADCVGGVIESEGDTYLGRAIALAMSSRFGVGGASFRVGGRGPADTVAFGAYRRDVFDRIGRFTEEIEKGEDDEFNYRLRDAGGSILLVPGIRARYTVRGGLRGLWRQYFGYGRAKPEVLRRHPAQMRLRQLAPAALVLAGGVATARAISGSPTSLRILAVVYTCGATTASLALASQRRWRYFPVLPIAFACLHLSYGLGFIAGLSDLAGRMLSRTARPGVHQRTEIAE
jgi:cellulose synthase/poly-beta-1,6-N-acetylglucosamine synthase-like glycosyltransferase